MKNFRLYGKSPFTVAVIHGGPGAAGEMRPVAEELSTMSGILEPLQTEKTVESQVGELEDVLTQRGNPPLVLIGWSWGAWLSFMLAAQNASLVNKLILIGSGPFEEKDAQNIMSTRLKKMSEEDRAQVLLLIDALEGSGTENKDAILMRLGNIISKADSYDPLPNNSAILECRYDIYRNVWSQAEALRKSGYLLSLGKKIRCPVVAIHGDYDPHPADGVRRPLQSTLEDFRFILLEKCGHTPWIERWAKDRFYRILRTELGWSMS